MAQSEDFSIIPADPELHAGPIVALIKELAEYENLIDQFKEVALEDHLAKEYCKAYVATSEGKVVGYALYFYAYSTWEGRFIFMEDLYVQPAYRNRGIGKALWKRIAQVCVEENINRLQWNVLNWNKNAKDFYKKQGAVNLVESEGWEGYRLTREHIEKMAQE